MSNHSLPAILGGKAVRTEPHPTPNFIGPQERALVNEVLDSGVLSDFVAHAGPSFNGGRMVKAFEAEFCSRFGVRHAVSVNSATSGLHAAVAAALAGLGDEVIVPPYTMSATATVVACTNATPIFADIRPDTFCIDVEDVKRKLSPRTKAIIAVNLFGGPAALDELKALADANGLVLIEDNAQAPGAKLRSRWTGTIGHVGIFSFNCHKTIQCGEGGVIVTNDDVLADRLRLMRNHGEVVQSQRDTVAPELAGLLGYNYRLTEMQAAVALGQLRRLDELTANRIAIANVLTSRLRGIDGLTTPFVVPESHHVYYSYVLKVDAGRLGLTRAEFCKALGAEGFGTGEGYVKPIYQYPMYRRAVAEQRTGFGAGVWHPKEPSAAYEKVHCPVTERMYEHELFTTGICRGDLGEEHALEFVEAIEKIVAHAKPIRAHLHGTDTAA